MDEKKEKGKACFVNAVADKIIAVVLEIIAFGLLNSHGENPLLIISNLEIDVLCAGGLISTVTAFWFGFTSYFKEIESTAGVGFLVISMTVLFHLIYSIVASCIIMRGFQRTSNWIIWFVGSFICILILLVWMALLHLSMIQKAVNWMKCKFQKMLGPLANFLKIMFGEIKSMAIHHFKRLSSNVHNGSDEDHTLSQQRQQYGILKIKVVFRVPLDGYQPSILFDPTDLIHL